jgi:ParB/RepB/Spo0J family partition protein
VKQTQTDLPTERESAESAGSMNQHAEPHRNGKPASSAAKPPRSPDKKQSRAKPARKSPTLPGQLKWEAKNVPVDELIVLNADRTELDPADDKAQEKQKRFVASVKEYGVVEPLVVRWVKKLKQYSVIAGRRRLEAAKEAGLSVVPCRVLVSECDDVQEAEISIIENLEREDLTPYEWAVKFQALTNATGKKMAAAKVYDVAKGTVSEHLRLLDDDVIKFLTSKQFMDLKRGKLSAKAVSRNVRKLENARENGTYDATLAEIKDAMNGGKTKEFHTYKKFTFPDADAELTFQTKGRSTEAPEVRVLIESLRRWLHKLEMQSSAAKASVVTSAGV